MAFEFFELSRFLGRKIALYRFERQGTPLVERFNSTSRDLTIAGNLYKGARGIAHSAIRESSSSSQKNELTITMPYVLDAGAPEFPVTQALGNWWRPYPPSQRVLVHVLTTHLGDPDEEVNIEWMGRVVGPKYARTKLTLRCDPSFRSGRIYGSIPRVQRVCGVPLYSKGLGMCNLDPEPIAVPGTLTAVDGTTLTSPAFAAAPRTLAGMWLSWFDDEEELQTTAILSHSGDTVTVFDESEDFEPGLQVTAYTIPLWFEATLTDVSGLSLTAAEFAGSPHSLAGGAIYWTRDDGVQEHRTIMSHSGDTITIQYGALDLATDLVVRTYFGCAHNLPACAALGNEINYPGFVHLPTENPMPRSMAW